MEILHEVEYNAFYIIYIIIITLMLLFVCIMLVLSIMMLFNEKDLIFFLASVFFMLFVIIFGSILYNVVRSEPLIEYKALITDFNEVYDNGYKIVKQEGKIYTLVKDQDGDN